MTPDTRNDLLIPRRQLLDCQELLQKARDRITDLETELKEATDAMLTTYLMGFEEGKDAAKNTQPAKPCACAICRAEKDHGKP